MKEFGANTFPFVIAIDYNRQINVVRAKLTMFCLVVVMEWGVITGSNENSADNK